MSIEISGGDQPGMPLSKRAEKVTKFRSFVQSDEDAGRISQLVGSVVETTTEPVDAHELSERYHAALRTMKQLIEALPVTDARSAAIEELAADLELAWRGGKKPKPRRTGRRKRAVDYVREALEEDPGLSIPASYRPPNPVLEVF